MIVTEYLVQIQAFDGRWVIVDSSLDRPTAVKKAAQAAFKFKDCKVRVHPDTIYVEGSTGEPKTGEQVAAQPCA